MSTNGIFEQPVIRGECNGVPLQSFGYMPVLSQSPDLIDDIQMQVDNVIPLTKVRSKKSWEIKSNLIGTTTPRMPRTTESDEMPLEPINLIDGNPDTCWCSRTQPKPNVEPIWIRIDLPVEQLISKVILKKRKNMPPRNADWQDFFKAFNAVEVGRGMPGKLTLKISTDAWHWETLFDGPTDDTPKTNEFEVTFSTHQAKQIWIIGTDLPSVENILFAFSIAAVEIYNEKGINIALASRGVGVMVNSTMHTHGQEMETHRWFWPLHYDLGLKLARIGYHDDPINWHWVEKQRGKLQIDPYADASITDLVDHGVDIVMSLGFGNRLYTQKDQTRKLPQLWQWYYEDPAPPTTPEALDAWARYVRFMAEHFKDRVKIFEVWNEWNISLYWGEEPNLENYLKVANVAIPILREVAPNAKIMLGSISGFVYQMSEWTPEELASQEKSHLFLRAVKALAHDVDLIGWHPFYQTNPDNPEVKSYTADVYRFQAFCEANGFRGQYMVTEWNYAASYPAPVPPNWWGSFECSELQKAKYVARMIVMHSAMGIASFFCETWNSTHPLDLSLLRRSFAADPVYSLQPQAAYYVLRNLATALEDLTPHQISFKIENSLSEIEVFTLKREGQTVLALWTPGIAKDHCDGLPVDIVINGAFSSAMGYDPINGVEGTLNIESIKGEVRIPKFLIKDYPVLVFFK
jgi:hypothetical protein